MALMERQRRKKKARPSKHQKTCQACTALCCRDLTMMITKPRTEDDLDELNWYLRFDTVQVFVRSYRWYLMFKGKCIYLSRNNRCKIYDQRPSRCRRHEPPACERFGEYYDVMISTPDELMTYLNGRSKR